MVQNQELFFVPKIIFLISGSQNKRKLWQMNNQILNLVSYLSFLVQGHLHTYRFCDNVWTFILQDAMFKSDDRQENVSRVKIVACDSKLLTQ